MPWQAWCNILGLVFDLLGFSLLAIEWRRSFRHSVETRQDELQDAYQRNRTREQKKKVVSRREREEETMAKEFSKLAYQESQRRYWLFRVGVTLFVIGVILQVIGSLPLGRT
jgi:hypothetical protein